MARYIFTFLEFKQWDLEHNHFGFRPQLKCFILFFLSTH